MGRKTKTALTLLLAAAAAWLAAGYLLPLLRGVFGLGMLLANPGDGARELGQFVLALTLAGALVAAVVWALVRVLRGLK